MGEELFRLPRSEFPELGQIRKELNLLQKLYKLYNDVIDRVSSYYDIPWGEVNIEDINNELMEFQNRCVFCRNYFHDRNRPVLFQQFHFIHKVVLVFTNIL